MAVLGAALNPQPLPSTPSSRVQGPARPAPARLVESTNQEFCFECIFNGGVERCTEPPTPAPSSRVQGPARPAPARLVESTNPEFGFQCIFNGGVERCAEPPTPALHSWRRHCIQFCAHCEKLFGANRNHSQHNSKDDIYKKSLTPDSTPLRPICYIYNCI